jgi:alpha-ketoglutarate-dependent taurine dioxygenase
MTEPRQHYEHSSAWKPSELGGKQGVSIALSPSHIDAFDNALRKVQQAGIEIEDITRDDFPVDDIADSVGEWENEIQEGKGLLVLTGFPVDKYSKQECGMIYFGLGTHFGEAQSQSLLGDKLGHVVDIGGKDTRERAYRNSAELSLHTDASDIVGMMCLVKAKQGGLSGYCSGPAVYNHILENHSDLVETLFDGYIYHLFGEEEPGASPVTDHKIAVFSETQGYLSTSFLRSYIELAFEEMGIEKTELEARALDVFDEVAHSDEFRLDCMMEPGDIAFFNNYTVLHTRTEFFDDDEPEKRRHLLRLWLRAWNSRPLAGDIGTYKARKGIDKQEGRGTYYTGTKEYVESPPPK